MKAAKIDIWNLYHHMYRSRIFEEAVGHLWADGLISGEMHMGMGEEAICAGVNIHLQEDDALALDHRGTPPMVMRGTELSLILLELLGHEDGLCGGMGGHMHLFDPDRLAASSGIVGSSGPSAAGFALAAKYLRPGKIAVAYFGEGAMNEGMLMESFNLAVAWQLPILFVCKNNDWAITTQSSQVTGGSLPDRARSFGLTTREVDGFNVESVADITGPMIDRIRDTNIPAFLFAECIHLEGHFLGDPMLQFTRKPLNQLKKQGIPMAKSAIKFKGASIGQRVDALKKIIAIIGKSARDHFIDKKDPLKITRDKLLSDNIRLIKIEDDIDSEIKKVVDEVFDVIDKSQIRDQSMKDK